MQLPLDVFILQAVKARQVEASGVSFEQPKVQQQGKQTHVQHKVIGFYLGSFGSLEQGLHHATQVTVPERERVEVKHVLGEGAFRYRMEEFVKTKQNKTKRNETKQNEITNCPYS